MGPNWRKKVYLPDFTRFCEHSRTNWTDNLKDWDPTIPSRTWQKTGTGKRSLDGNWGKTSEWRTKTDSFTNVFSNISEWFHTKQIILSKPSISLHLVQGFYIHINFFLRESSWVKCNGYLSVPQVVGKPSLTLCTILTDTLSR